MMAMSSRASAANSLKLAFTFSLSLVPPYAVRDFRHDLKSCMEITSLWKALSSSGVMEGVGPSDMLPPVPRTTRAYLSERGFRPFWKRVGGGEAVGPEGLSCRPVRPSSAPHPLVALPSCRKNEFE